MFIDAPVALTLVVGLAGPYTQTVDELPGSDLGFFDQHRTKPAQDPRMVKNLKRIEKAWFPVA